MRERRESYARFFFQGREERIIFGRGGEKNTREGRREFFERWEREFDIKCEQII
jgi:hypothetical protein